MDKPVWQGGVADPVDLNAQERIRGKRLKRPRSAIRLVGATLQELDGRGNVHATSRQDDAAECDGSHKRGK